MSGSAQWITAGSRDAVQFSSPLTIANADVSDCTSSNWSNLSCTVTCLADYGGAPTASCTTAGTWQVSDSCAPVSCGPLSFANADTSDCNAHPWSHETCHLACLDGVIGFPSACCSADGSWQVDGGCALGLFGDGFESGDTSRWTAR